MISKRTAWMAAVTMVLGTLSACSDTRSSGPETVAPTDSVATVTDPPTTPAPDTIAPTTLAPTTTVVERAFLRADGLGPFNFGASAAEVLVGMPLGVVLSDDDYTLPMDGVSFNYDSGRHVCWSDGGPGTLCAFFGGVDALSQVLVGWEYGASAGLGLLYSESGATVNILVSAVPAMPLPEGDCYGDTFVELDGISVHLSSNSDEWFGSYAADGTFVLTVPQPAGATATYMSAGDQMYFGEGADC